MGKGGHSFGPLDPVRGCPLSGPWLPERRARGDYPCHSSSLPGQPHHHAGFVMALDSRAELALQPCLPDVVPFRPKTTFSLDNLTKHDQDHSVQWTHSMEDEQEEQS